MARGLAFTAVFVVLLGFGPAASAQQGQKGGRLGDTLAKLRQQQLQKQQADKDAKKDPKKYASKDRQNLKLVNPSTFATITVEKLNAILAGELAGLGQTSEGTPISDDQFIRR